MAKKRKKAAKSKAKTGEGSADPLECAVDDIRKQFGEGAIMRLGEDFHVDVDAISTGALSLDLALGVGGVPRGRVIEIYGPEASGKTTLSLNIIAQAQRKGGIAAFIDAEHALDPSYARKIGVNLDDLLVSQPDTGEQALEIAERLIRSNAVDVVVIDSVAALVTKAEIEGEMGQAHVGLLARLMSQALRKLTAAIHKTRTCMIFINQIRMKIGVMFGSPETTPGGRALKFHASVRIDIRRIGSIKDGDVFVGNQVRAKVAKNKVAPPFRMAEFEILFNRGISWEGTLLDVAVNMKIVDRAGAWFSYRGTRLGQGREQARRFLEENQDITQEIEGLVRAAHAQSMGLDIETDEDEGENGSETPEETDTTEEAGAEVETEKATKK